MYIHDLQRIRWKDKVQHPIMTLQGAKVRDSQARSRECSPAVKIYEINNRYEDKHRKTSDK